jgi:hypothetical protein
MGRMTAKRGGQKILIVIVIEENGAARQALISQYKESIRPGCVRGYDKDLIYCAESILLAQAKIETGLNPDMIIVSADFLEADMNALTDWLVGRNMAIPFVVMGQPAWAA